MNAETVNSHYDYGGMDYRWYSAHDPSAPQSKTYINEWEEGTLIIDVVDAKKGELVWRGQGSALIEEEKSPDREQSDFNAVVKTIMAGFPRVSIDEPLQNTRDCEILERDIQVGQAGQLSGTTTGA